VPARVDALLAGSEVQQLAGVLLEQVTDLRTVGGLVGAVVEVHVRRLSSMSGTAAA
jgi:hypothetical protein